MPTNHHRTVDEWERHLGQQVRELRLRADVTQAELARRADLSLSAIRNLEAGRGSSLASLVKVARALGRSDWLESFAPPVTISPMQLLRERQQQGPGRRRASSGAAN